MISHAVVEPKSIAVQRRDGEFGSTTVELKTAHSHYQAQKARASPRSAYSKRPQRLGVNERKDIEDLFPVFDDLFPIGLFAEGMRDEF